jgi:hypothetical protein
MKTIIKMFKLIGGIMITIGVAALVKNVLEMITPPGAKAVIRICMRVAAYFLGGLAAKAVADSFEVKVDSTVKVIETVSKLIDEKSEKIEEKLIET